MKDDPIVSEVRRVREALWQEAGCNLTRLGDLVRRAAAGVSQSGPSIANAEQLRRYVEQTRAATPALREEPPAYDEGFGKI
jgi:hypothetical protein